MKLFIAIFYLSLFSSNFIWGQSNQNTKKYSFSILNGLSSQDESKDHNVAYVNGFRFQIAIEKSQKYRSIIGLQYGKNGNSIDWVCGEDWDYCQIFGAPPIDVKSVDRKHYLSLFFNPRYTFDKRFYLQGGLSIDFPIQNKLINKYKSSDGEKSRDKVVDVYGGHILRNTTIGANIICGKEIQINERWDWFFEIEYKMYNLIAIRSEDYEDYFFKKNQKPWIFGLNVGISIH